MRAICTPCPPVLNRISVFWLSAPSLRVCHWYSVTVWLMMLWRRSWATAFMRWLSRQRLLRSGGITPPWLRVHPAWEAQGEITQWRRNWRPGESEVSNYEAVVHLLLDWTVKNARGCCRRGIKMSDSSLHSDIWRYSLILMIHSWLNGTQDSVADYNTEICFYSYSYATPLLNKYIIMLLIIALSLCVKC